MQSSYSVLKYTKVKGKELIKTPSIDFKKDDNILSDENNEISKGDSILNNAWENAEEIVKIAQGKAAKIIEDAKKDGEKIKSSAKEEGYQKGYKIGYSEGYDYGISEAVKEADSIKKEGNEYLKSCNDAVDRFLNEKHDAIITLAINIAKQIINSEISLNQDVVLNIAEKVLSKATDKRQIVIKVNPDDYKLLISKKEELSIYVEGSNNLFIVADYAIERGQIKAETPSGFIDGKIDTQLKLVLKSLIEG